MEKTKVDINVSLQEQCVQIVTVKRFEFANPKFHNFYTEVAVSIIRIIH